MLQCDQISPFHEGERRAQTCADAGEVAQWASGFIRDYLPEQHRDFHTGLPFLVVSGADTRGRVWITMLDGPDGFLTSPHPHRIDLAGMLDVTDPLVHSFENGADVGVLGIDLASRRRNRFSGVLRRTKRGYAITVRQTFGNCPKYIHERAWRRVPNPVDVDARISDALSDAQILRIKAADTMFIGSGHRGHPGAPSSGYDASHRGGAPGFVRVVSATHLQIPDYPGNNFFNTIGNLMSDPRVGLLFVDFETGGLLHITGRADIDWTPGNSHGPNAARVITVEIDQIIERPGAVSLRWSTQDHLKQSLRVIKREQESATITSFSLAAPDGRPLDAFKAGQHLPIEVDIPGQAGPLNRSYSLSGSPNDLSHYRVSIKREDKGLVSRFFHDKVHIGSTIKASPPTGDFTIPCSTCPLFLISAGVGMTPMVAAMLANATETNREVWYIHGARNGSTHAFQSEVDALVAQNPQLHKYICYSQPESTDVEGRDYDARGHVTAQKVISLNPSPNAHFMLCGPADFLAEMRGGLEMAGVPEGKIHLETFGTKQVIRLGERHDFQTLT